MLEEEDWSSTVIRPSDDRNNAIALNPISPYEPSISYVQHRTVGGASVRDMKVARWNGASWDIDTLDSAGDAGYGNDIVIAPMPPYAPHVSYNQLVSRILVIRYGVWNGSSWQLETIERLTGTVGQVTSIALDQVGRPHICYSSGAGEIHHAYKDLANQWQIEALGIGTACSMAIDMNNQVHVIYRSLAANLMYRYQENGIWQPEESVSSSVGGSKLAVDSENRPHIIFGQNDNVMYATRDIPNHEPTADAGGPYTVAEGSSRHLDGTDSFDPDVGDTLTYQWDLDYDGVTFDIDSNDPMPLFDAAYLDGPDIRTVALRVSDNWAAMSEIDVTTVTVENVAPMVETLVVPLDPINLDAQAGFSVDVTFSDPAGVEDAPYSCDFDLDYDGSTFEPDVTQNGVMGTTCSAPLNYSEPGTYIVMVHVTDKDGGIGSLVATEHIIIYDPTGGFVTGGGWIMSPPAACQLPWCSKNTTGKVNFGFVAKYRQGAWVPTGNTEFNFRIGDLKFHSDTYDWLVVNPGGTEAQFKGEGIINGAQSPTGEPYEFMLWAQDQSPQGDDTLRMKIWYEDSGNEIVVYDNGFDQTLGGGQIKIHN